MTPLSADVCVMGAGPAGCVMAARLAQLGLAVCLVERETFPRHHLGESLSPGVLPLLATIGARDTVEAAGFTRVRRVLSNWDGPLAERVDASEQGLLVDRGRFDALLADRARALGVEVMQPAVVREFAKDDDGWRLGIEAAGSLRHYASDISLMPQDVPPLSRAADVERARRPLPCTPTGKGSACRHSRGSARARTSGTGECRSRTASTTRLSLWMAPASAAGADWRVKRAFTNCWAAPA